MALHVSVSTASTQISSWKRIDLLWFFCRVVKSVSSTLFGLVLVALLLWLVAVCTYRLYFHPLAKYPGPFLARLTTLYGAYHGWKGDWSTELHRLHQKYGDYVRWTPDYVIINTAQAFQDIYGHGTTTLKAKNYVVLAHKAPSVLTIRDPRKHRLRRQRVTQALSEDNIRRLEPGMKEHIGKFCEQMGPDSGHWSTPRDMSKWSNYLLFDIMMSLVFGNPLRLVTEATYRHIPEAIHQSSRRQSIYLHSMKLALLAYFRLDEPLFPKAIEARNVFVSFLRDALKTRFKKSLNSQGGGQCHDMYAFLQAVSKQSDAEPLTLAEFNAECATMVIAGSDTTATSLAACLFYLGRYRGAYKLAADEVRSRFKSASDICLGSGLSSCIYLRACIHEALRLSPAVGISLPRETPKDGAVVNGTFVPGGVLVGSGIYSIHHNETHFSDPYTYRPERWLPDRGGAKDLTNHDTRAYGPFQIGPRGCLGKGIAMHELMLTMAHIFFRFDFQTTSREGEVITVDGPVRSPIPGVTELPIQEFVTAQCTGPYVKYRYRDIDR